MGAGFVSFQHDPHVLEGITEGILIGLCSIKFDPQRAVGVGLSLYNSWDTAHLRADRSCPALIQYTLDLPHDVPELSGNFRPENLGELADTFKRKHSGVVMNTQLRAPAILCMTNMSALDAFTRYQTLG